jgi:hypothetical protein
MPLLLGLLMLIAVVGELAAWLVWLLRVVEIRSIFDRLAPAAVWSTWEIFWCALGLGLLCLLLARWAERID